MSESEFTINPDSINRRRKNSSNRRPLPPGQTRHMYRNETEPLEDPDYADGEDEDDSNADPVNEFRHHHPRRQRRRRNDDYDDDEPSERTPWLVRTLLDRRVAIWLGIIFILLGGTILVVLLSHLHSGALDRSAIVNLSPYEIIRQGIPVESVTGPAGAWLGNLLFAESFGLGAFVIAVYFAILGVRLLVGRKFDFWGLTLRCLLLAISVSIVIGLVTYALGSTVFWGGTHGHYVNKWLLAYTGVPGALIVSLALIGTLVALYINEITRFYNGWKSRLEHRRQEKLMRKQAAAEAKEAENTDDDADDDDNINIVSTDDSDDHKQPQSPSIATLKTSAEGTGVVFEIDTPASADGSDTDSSPDQGDSEPGFEIDVPIAETGKKTGTVAERLVAEQGEYNPRAELSRYKFPELNLLADIPVKATVDTEEQQANKDRIIKTLGNYGITIESIKATVGPTVTLYEIVPTEGIRISQIKRLEDDIALSLAAKGIRIIAPMPGKGTVGIEVPNSDPQIVTMRSILSSKKFRESKAILPVALGATISNEIFVTDLASMPHALVAGATGQGKSVGLNVIISSLLYRKHPAELKFVLIDPKMVEFSVYEQLRGHYLASLPGEDDAIVTDPSKVLNVLNSLCTEMDNRYALLRSAAVNKIEDYNRKFCQRRLSMDKGHRYLPYIVVIIDEFADLIMTGGKEIELPVMRITQKARAVGIHMIIATQRPSTNVLTGLIKANCPSRIAFRVLQNVDSRTILDRPGAEQLIGRGDMLYSMGGELERMQCAFISSDEIATICAGIDAQPGYEEPYPLPEPKTEGAASGAGGGIAAGGMERDPLFDDAARFIVTSSTASTSSLQRRYQIGYNRAGKIIDQMEAAGIVGPPSGSKPRSVLVDPAALERILANR